MKRVFRLLCCSVFVAGGLSAVTPAEIVLAELKVGEGISQKTYTNLRATKIEPDGIRFVHDGGVVKVPYEALPPEIQAKMEYDPSKAEEHRAMVQAGNAAALARAEAERAAQRKSEEDEAAPPPSKTITLADVKTRWMAMWSQELNPLDREITRKRAEQASMLEAISSGKFDLKAAKFAHEYNAWVYRQEGDETAAAEEMKRIQEIERTEAMNRMAAATDNTASAINRLAAVLENPFRQRIRGYSRNR